MTQRIPWYRPTNARITVFAIAAMFVFGVVGVIWGTFFPAHVPVEMLDAGPETGFAIGKVVVFPEQNVYLIGLPDGEIRAVDGVVKGDHCTLEYRPDDLRGTSRNPLKTPGVLVDPCSGAVWAATGDAIEGADEPLRTFSVMGVDGPDGTRHVSVEVIGDRHPEPRASGK
jgi:hypothetical protein